jgi:lipopolysaccharide transport system ATP-binding protein
VDEVLAVGDAEFQKKCLGKMSNVASEGRTILFVSHNMAAVSNICNKTAIITHGQISNFLPTSDGIQVYLDSLSDKKTEQSVTDLTGITERRGSGPIKLKRFFCENETGSIVNSFVSGQQGRFVIEYESLQMNPAISGVEVSIIIYTSDGIRVANLWNVYKYGSGFTKIPPSGRFICDLPKIPFRSGRYYVDLYCAVNRISSDWIQLASVFSVVDGDYYGSGKIPESAKGIVFLDHNWQVKEI